MPSNYNVEPLNLTGVKTYPLASRHSKVVIKQFAKPCDEESALRKFLSRFPDVLATQSLRELANYIRIARDAKKPIIWGLGGHVIKTGLAPIIVDLIQRGFVTAVATNGSVLVHDSEIALVGSTSEDVDSTLSEGIFGGAQETAELINSAAREGAGDQIGLGEAVGRGLTRLNPPNKEVSILCACYSLNIPFTAHLTIGGDTTHFHPTADGASLGATTHTDFRLLAELVRQINGGGVYLNVGSAVVLPEVFLKCVTLVRNLGHPLQNITTANFDFIQSYRTLTNVVRRPTAQSGRGFAITGHHELTIPLLAAELICGPSDS